MHAITRLAAVVASGALVLGTGACADDDGTMATTETTTETSEGNPVTDPATDDDSAELEASFDVTSDYVIVRYRWTNSGPEPKVATTALAVDRGATVAPDPAVAYVRAAADGTVVISQSSFVAPGEVDAPARIYGQVVAPGASVGGEVRVPLPLTASYPYRDADASDAIATGSTTARFCLGVYGETSATRSAATVEEHGRTWLELSMGDLGSGGICSPTVSLQLG